MMSIREVDPGEILGSHLRCRLIECDDVDNIGAMEMEEFSAAIDRQEHRRHRIWAEHGRWMGVEGQCDHLLLALISQPTGMSQQSLMTTMDPIENSQRDDAGIQRSHSGSLRKDTLVIDQPVTLIPHRQKITPHGKECMSRGGLTWPRKRTTVDHGSR